VSRQRVLERNIRTRRVTASLAIWLAWSLKCSALAKTSWMSSNTAIASLYLFFSTAELIPSKQRGSGITLSTVNSSYY